MLPKVVVFIVVWNGMEDTLECLASLVVNGYPNMEIVVVDNGSTDGSAEAIRRKQLSVRIIDAGANLGFTGGNNLGLAEARRLKARYAFLLNNDTTLEKGAVRALVDAAELDAEAGIVAPVMHYYDAPLEIWFAGGRLSLDRGEATHDQQLIPTRQCTPYPTPWVSGCAMLVRMQAVEEVGGLDDRFYLTWEDVDWSVRMRRQGWTVLVVPMARIFHKCGRSGEKLKGIGSYYAVRNSLLLVSKHADKDYLRAAFRIIGSHLRAGLRLKQTDSLGRLATTWRGARDHFLGRYGRCRGRSQKRWRLRTDIKRGGVDAIGPNKQ